MKSEKFKELFDLIQTLPGDKTDKDYAKTMLYVTALAEAGRVLAEKMEHLDRLVPGAEAMAAEAAEGVIDLKIQVEKLREQLAYLTVEMGEVKSQLDAEIEYRKDQEARVQEIERAGGGEP